MRSVSSNAPVIFDAAANEPVGKLQIYNAACLRRCNLASMYVSIARLTKRLQPPHDQSEPK